MQVGLLGLVYNFLKPKYKDSLRYLDVIETARGCVQELREGLRGLCRVGAAPEEGHEGAVERRQRDGVLLDC